MTPAGIDDSVRLKSPVFSGETPDAEDNKIVLCPHPIGTTSVRTAVIRGPAFVNLDVTDATHGYARPIVGDVTKLRSHASLGHEVLWKDSGTGTKDAVVDLSGGGGRTGSGFDINISTYNGLTLAAIGSAGDGIAMYPSGFSSKKYLGDADIAWVAGSSRWETGGTGNTYWVHMSVSYYESWAGYGLVNPAMTNPLLNLMRECELVVNLASPTIYDVRRHHNRTTWTASPPAVMSASGVMDFSALKPYIRTRDFNNGASPIAINDWTVLNSSITFWKLSDDSMAAGGLT